MQIFYPQCRIFYICALLAINSLFCKISLADQLTYSVGVVPQYDARQIYNTLNPILEYLSQQTGMKFILASSPDIPTFEKQLAEGKFDFAYTNPFVFLKAHKSLGYRAILRDGQRQLQGIIVSNKNGPHDSPLSIHNKRLALPAPNSLGASLMVRYELQKMGVIITPQYVKSHKSVYLQVASGRLPAGGGVQSTFDSQPDSVRNRLKIIYRTQALAPHPIIVHPRIPEHDVGLTVEAFLHLNRHAKGKELLANIPMHKIIHTSIQDYANISNIDLTAFTH